MKNKCLQMVHFIVLLSVLSGCAGRTAYPIKAQRSADDHVSCEVLLSEMQEIEKKIDELRPYESKFTRNLVLGVGGIVFFPLWFFMDFKDAEKVEINAYRARYNHLRRLYQQKKCALGDVIEMTP